MHRKFQTIQEPLTYSNKQQLPAVCQTKLALIWLELRIFQSLSSEAHERVISYNQLPGLTINFCEWAYFSLHVSSELRSAW